MKIYFTVTLVLLINAVSIHLILWMLRQAADLFVFFGLLWVLLVVPINYILIKTLFTKNKKQ